MDPAAVTLAILLLAVVAFLTNRIPLEIIAVGVCLSLYFTGVLTLGEALSGFGDPTVLFIATLFVVSESLDATGITAWVGQRVISRAGGTRGVLTVVISLLAAVLSALISPTGAVAALYPLVAIVASRVGLRSSALLMPLAFAAHAGSLLLLTGTPVNIIVSDAAVETGSRAFGFFEFALVGVPLLLASMVILVVAGPRLLPERTGGAMPLDLARYARRIRDQYALESDRAPLMSADRGITEAIILPRSKLIGVEFSPGVATPSGDLVLLGARRGTELLKGKRITVQAGDVLLLQGTWEDLGRHTATSQVIAVDEPSRLRRAVPLGQGAKRAVVGLAVMIVLLATGLVPPAAAALLAAGALVLSRTVTTTQAYRSISWTTVVLIAGMIPLSTAFLNTGAADLVARGLLVLVGGAGPTVVLLVLCLTALVLGQIISNVATVLVLVPVAVSLAANLGLSVQPFMMALTVVGAASFLTPIATPANLMVMEPGGYRFGDYWKLGLPLALLFLAVAVFYVPLVWPFG